MLTGYLSLLGALLFGDEDEKQEMLDSVCFQSNKVDRRSRRHCEQPEKPECILIRSTSTCSSISNYYGKAHDEMDDGTLEPLDAKQIQTFWRFKSQRQAASITFTNETEDEVRDDIPLPLGLASHQHRDALHTSPSNNDSTSAVDRYGVPHAASSMEQDVANSPAVATTTTITIVSPDESRSDEQQPKQLLLKDIAEEARVPSEDEEDGDEAAPIAFYNNEHHALEHFAPIQRAQHEALRFPRSTTI